MDKVAVVNGLIGRAYDLRRFNCWHLTAVVLEKAYGRSLPKFRVRDAATREARMEAMSRFDGWDAWQEASVPQDGAIILMKKGGCQPDMHAGVWIDLGLHSGVIHCDDAPMCVCFDDLVHLRARGYTDLRYFTPR
jgi:hypothetical protein